jgi:hypothetical protein
LLPLSAVADIVRDQGPNAISRESVERVQFVLANVQGRDLGAVVADIRTAIEPVQLPQGARIELGGQFESAASATQTLLALGAIVLIGMFLLLRQAFNSSRDAGIVMLNLPLALVGGVVGLWATGGVLSVATIVGFITLFGIATRNGVMLVSHIQHVQKVDGITDLQTAVLHQGFGNGFGGGADVEDHRAVVRHRPGHGQRNTRLAIGVEAFALAVREVFNGRARRPHAAVESRKQASLRQALHISAHGLQGDTQRFGELLDHD